jgi:hypothetical protein
MNSLFRYELVRNMKSCGEDKEWIETTNNAICSGNCDTWYLQQAKIIYKSILDINYTTYDCWLYHDNGRNVYKAPAQRCVYDIVVSLKEYTMEKLLGVEPLEDYFNTKRNILNIKWVD